MQINNMCVAKGELCILCNGNEIAFGSPMQQQTLEEDYWFIYWHLVPKELTGIDAKYDIAHKLSRGTFATAMKAIAHNTGEWWAIKIIHTQKLHPSNNNNNNENNGSGAGPSGHNGHRSPTTSMKNLKREINILEKLNHPNICRRYEAFPPNEGGNDYCEIFFN
jgi:ser/thr/tyr protein kinase RAD53